MCFQIAPVIEDIDDFPMSIKERKLKQFYSLSLTRNIIDLVT